jgi:predicted DNA-binding ribbon-helix-helix protein
MTASDDDTPPRHSSQSRKPAPSTLVNKNVTIDGRRTSVRLEPVMWNGLAEICWREADTMHAVCSEIARHKAADTSLTSAIRLFIIAYFRDAATNEGHTRAGHGQNKTNNTLLRLVQSILNPAADPYERRHAPYRFYVRRIVPLPRLPR